MKAGLKFDVGSYSIAGHKAHNEDTCGYQIPEEPLLTTKGAAFAIADGMSTAEAGRKASRASVQGFLADYFSSPESWSVKNSVHKVLSALNQWLYSHGQKYGGAKGMVATLSTLVIKSTTAHLFHVGDTRIYRLQGDKLELLTQDHRIQISGDKACLTRAMGIELHADIDYRTLPVEVNDVFLLITDGVYEFLQDGRILEILQANPNDQQQACRTMIEEALDNGSDDNLTCQCLRITHLPDQDEYEFYNKLSELPFPPPLEPGMVLDGYKVLRQLFANKRTELYLVEDTDTGKQCVLKAPSVNYEDDPEYINQYLHEEWAGRRINNPHVLKVLETTRKRQCLYYVTEYIDGQTLRQWMNDNPHPSLNKARDIAEQITRGLRAFHRLEMIHQDLKPENIIMDRNGTVKIIDFGSTKIAGIEEITTPFDSDNILGTINYTAPEYHLGEQITNRADIFSLAVIVYEMLTGASPFSKELTARNLRKVAYISTKEHTPEVPGWMDKALEKALSINPRFRYEHLSEFMHDLSYPNMALMEEKYVPLLEKSPVSFWRGLAILLLIINILLLYFHA